jgi:rhamnogalacturonan hydrolase
MYLSTRFLSYSPPLTPLDWNGHTTPNTGAVKLSNLRFSNWTGTVDNGKSRGPIVIRGSNIVPLTDITLEGFEMWTETRDQLIHQCRNVYGTGYCARQLPEGASPTEFSSSITVNSVPTGFVKPNKPDWGVSGYDVTVSIPVYTPAVRWGAPGFGVKNGAAPTPTAAPKVRRGITHPHVRHS